MRWASYRTCLKSAFLADHTQRRVYLLCLLSKKKRVVLIFWDILIDQTERGGLEWLKNSSWSPESVLRCPATLHYRVGSHLNFRTAQNEIFQRVSELSGTHRSSFDVKPISSMTSEDFSDVYWYSGLQVVFVMVFQPSVDFLCKNSYKSSSLLDYFDCFLSNHTVGCCNKNFSCLCQIRREKILLCKQCLCIFVVLFARLQLSRYHIWSTFHPATP